MNFVTRILDDASSGESEPQKSEIDLSDEVVRGEVRSALIGRSAGDTVETEFDVEPQSFPLGSDGYERKERKP